MKLQQMNLRIVFCLLTGLMLSSNERLQLRADEPARVTVAHGIMFLPLDFYPKHREELGLSADQVQEMKHILEDLHKSSEGLARELHERTQALQEVMAESSVNMDQAMARFKAVMRVEEEMKALQFRTRLVMRKVLKPEQLEKLQDLVAKARQSRSEQMNPGKMQAGDLLEKLQQVRQQINQRFDGQVPRELVAHLERVEKTARQGNPVEAEEQLDAVLRELSGGKESGRANDDKFRQQIEKMEQAIEKTSDPERREQIEKQIKKLRQVQQSNSQSKESLEHREELERQIRQISEFAEQSDNLELRERLHDALRKLREAAAAENSEVVGDIMRSVKLLIQGQIKKP